VRGGIIDVFPSTADVPVRIDLWGDEVDRLTAFAVNDQRSSPISTRPCSSAAGSWSHRRRPATARTRW
jgi:transcription-repair coupling factor (superfamily II helicase)